MLATRSKPATLFAVLWGIATLLHILWPVVFLPGSIFTPSPPWSAHCGKDHKIEGVDSQHWGENRHIRGESADGLRSALPAELAVVLGLRLASLDDAAEGTVWF